MDQFAALRSFLAVAKTGSFVAGARDLGQSKAAASKQVKALEARLGVALFARTSRSVTLTEAGRRFLERADDLMRRWNEAEDEARRHSAAPTGRLKVSASVSFGALHVAPVFARFLNEHPDMTGELDLSDRRVDLVEEGYDVVVRVARELPDASLRTRRLATACYVLVAAPHYLEARGEPRNPRELEGHECLHYAYGEERHTWRFHHQDGAVAAVRPGGAFTTNSGDALREAAIAGLGLARLPSFLLGDAIARGALRAVLPAWSDKPFEIHALTAPERAAPAKVRAFVARLADAFRAAPWDAAVGLRDASG